MFVDGDDTRTLLLPEQRPRDVRSVVAAHDNEIDVIARVRSLGLADGDASLLGKLGRVHERHRLVDDGTEDALQCRERQHPAVVVGDLTFICDLERPGRAAGQAGEQPAEPFDERKERTHRL